MHHRARTKGRHNHLGLALRDWDTGPGREGERGDTGPGREGKRGDTGPVGPPGTKEEVGQLGYPGYMG